MIEVGSFYTNGRLTRFYEIVSQNLDTSLVVKVYNSVKNKESLETISYKEFERMVNLGKVFKAGL